MSMAALILAAGRGQRMRPLSDRCPKPLLSVRGKPLVRYWFDALRAAGVQAPVVNTGWLDQQIEDYFAGFCHVLPAVGQAHSMSGPPPGETPARVRFSSEQRDFGHALETAGGIVRALNVLAPHAGDVFWVVAGDIFAPDFHFDPAAVQGFVASGRLAHLWLVPNPPHNPQGDFGLRPDGLLADRDSGKAHTFSTIGLYRRELFELPWCELPAGNRAGLPLPLAPLLRRAIAAGQVSGERYTGAWTDVGTPERLAELNRDRVASAPS